MQTRTESAGFSLVEILIAAVVMGIIMMGAISMMRTLDRSQKSSAQSVDFDNLVISLRLVLSRTSSCPAALQRVNGNPIVAPASVDTSHVDLPTNGINIAKIVIGSFELDTSKPYNGLYITDMKLRQDVAGSPDAANPTPYIGHIHIEGSKTAPGQGAAVGGGFLSKDIPIVFTIQGNAITSCNTFNPTGSGNGGVFTFIQPRVIAVAITDASWLPYASIGGTVSCPGSTWTKVTHSLLPAGKSVAKIGILTGSVGVYLAGKGQAHFVNTNQRQRAAGLLGAYASAGTSSAAVADVPLEDDGSFYVYPMELQPNYGAVISLIGYQ